MARVLLLDSDYTGEIKRCKIKDGNIIIGDKEFVVDKIRPIKVKSFMNKDDLYICKWDCLVGADFDVVEKEINKDEIEKKLREEGISEKEIDVIKKEIEKYEKSRGVRINRFVYKRLVPIEPAWVKTKLPSLLRDTANIRFLKIMSKYSEGRQFDIGGGKLIFIVFIVVFFLIFFVGILMKGGVK